MLSHLLAQVFGMKYPKSKKKCQKRFNKEMKNVLLDILKTEDDYIEIEKIIKSKEKLHI